MPRGRDARAALADQRPRHLKIRIDAGLDAPEDLQDVRIPVYDRGVGLLGVEEPGSEPGGHRHLRVAFEAQRARRARMTQPLQQQSGGAGVAEGVVHHQSGQRSLARPADVGVDQAGRQELPYTKQQLVAVAGRGCPGAVLRMHQQMQTPWMQLGRGQKRQIRDGPPLAREPPLPWQPGPQQRRDRGQQCGRAEAVRYERCGPGHGDTSLRGTRGEAHDQDRQLALVGTARRRRNQ